MGMYDHRMRASMGHKLQVELRDSMQRYNSNRTLLQQHFAQLCFDNKDLHTSPLPPSPKPPVKKWDDPNSKFGKAPEVAAQKARLAQLQQENNHLNTQENSAKANKTLLPPIQDNPKVEKTKTVSSPENQTAQTVDKTLDKVKSPQRQGTGRDKRSQKKKVTKNLVKQRDKAMPMLKLPTIYSASQRRSVWDSGLTHLHPVSQSTHLEKNQVDEDCRTFRHTSLPIPPIMDNKRTEVQRPPQLQQPVSSSKVKFTHRSHPPEHKLGSQHHIADHFPKLPPELDDCSSVGTGEGEEDFLQRIEKDEMKGREDERQSLPPLPQSLVTSSDHPKPADPHAMPTLRLRPGLTSSAISSATAQSGATFMSQVSKETGRWKGRYLSSEDPHHKSRVLADILHAVRQRMHDNEEELRLSGDYTGDSWSKGGHSDIMRIHGHTTNESGNTTARTSVADHKIFKLPQHKKQKLSQNRHNKLHRYLTKLSLQRKAKESHHHHHAPFHPAHKTIREMTPSSLDHPSTIQTAS